MGTLAQAFGFGYAVCIIGGIMGFIGMLLGAEEGVLILGVCGTFALLLTLLLQIA